MLGKKQKQMDFAYKSSKIDRCSVLNAGKQINTWLLPPELKVSILASVSR